MLALAEVYACLAARGRVATNGMASRSSRAAAHDNVVCASALFRYE